MSSVAEAQRPQVQRFFLPLPTEPRRFSRFQIADHGQKLLLLPQVDLIHSHLNAAPGRRRPCSQRSRYRKSIARTVLAPRPNCRATCRTGAFSRKISCKVRWRSDFAQSGLFSETGRLPQPSVRLLQTALQTPNAIAVRRRPI
jgi:hypothetical protein